MLNVLFYGLFFGVFGAGLGGVIGAFLGKSSAKLTAFLLSMSGGIMISVVCFDLLPGSLALSGLPLTLCAMFLGAFAVLLLSDVIDTRFAPAHSGTSGTSNGGGTAKMLRAGFTISAAMAIHNFPEGLAIGSGEVINKGLMLAVLISLHDIPEGIAMAVPLRAGGLKPFTVIGISLLSGIPTAVGAVAGFLIGSQSPYLVATSLALAGGAMLYVTMAEIFTRSKEIYQGRMPVFAALGGIAIGLIIINML